MSHRFFSVRDASMLSILKVFFDGLNSKTHDDDDDLLISSSFIF
jgi:hypothetical protein